MRARRPTASAWHRLGRQHDRRAPISRTSLPTASRVASTGSTITANELGLTTTGTGAGNHVGIELDASDNTIGGTSSGAGNTIGFNVNGIVINGAANNTVLGNFIGTDAAGDVLGNTNDGVLLEGGASSNVIGAPYAGNTIDANGNDGIEINASSKNAVQGNSLGASVSGASNLFRLVNFIAGVEIDNAQRATRWVARPPRNREFNICRSFLAFAWTVQAPIQTLSLATLLA